MGKVIDFPTIKMDLNGEDPEETAFAAGVAKCLNCKHEWNAVVIYADDGSLPPFLECPDCGLMRGKMNAPFYPEDGNTVVECRCSCDTFHCLEDDTGSLYLLCPNCGEYSQPWDE